MATNEKLAYSMPTFVGVDGEGGAHACLECKCAMFKPVGSNSYCLNCKHEHRVCYECDCDMFWPMRDDSGKELSTCATCRHEHTDANRHCTDCECKSPRWACEVCECGHNRSANSSTNSLGHSHEYLLLRAGDDYLYTGKPLTTWDCLKFLSELPTNKGGKHSEERIYVSYFFDYDSTMIIRGLTTDRARRLLYGRDRYCMDNACLGSTEKCHRFIPNDETETICRCGHEKKRHNKPRTGEHGQTLPVDVTSPDGDSYEIDYLPSKEFKIRKKGTKNWVEISDVGTFFQQSFMKSLTEWGIGTDEQRYLVKKGKMSRGSFVDMTASEIEYNRIECVLLESLMEDFRQACYDVTKALKASGLSIDIIPRKWQGPGRIAMAMLKAADLPTHDYLNLTQKVERIANSAYYGGRFEAPSIGYIEGPIYEYDRNSAYPFAMFDYLPCLQNGHGKWYERESRTELTSGSIWVAPIHFTTPNNKHVGGFPIREPNGPHAGSIYYPLEGNGTYWNIEIEAAERLGINVEITGPIQEFIQSCDCKPFDWIQHVFCARFGYGLSASSTTLSEAEQKVQINKLVKVIKLALNSLYGKQAQSIGMPPYANAVYAGLITAHMRAGLLDVTAMLDDDKDVLMYATDALFTRKPIDLPGVSTKTECALCKTTHKVLGEWDWEALETYDDTGKKTKQPFNSIFIVQPGVYLLEGAKPKTRGIPFALFVNYLNDFKDAWESLTDSAIASLKKRKRELTMPKVTLPTNMFRGARYALHLGRWETAGQWYDDITVFTFNWSTKRSINNVDLKPLNVLYCGGMHVEPPPKPGSKDLHSEPYGKAIGGWSDYEGRLMYESQPWGDGGLPDEYR